MSQEMLTLLGGMGGLAVGVIALLLAYHFIDEPFGRDAWKMTVFFAVMITLPIAFLVWSYFAWPHAWK